MKTQNHFPLNTTKSVNRFLLTAMTVAAVAMLSACGGGEDSGGSSTANETSPPGATAPQQEIIIIPSLSNPSAKKAVPAEEAAPIVAALRATAASAGGSTSSQLTQKVVISEDSEDLFNWAQVAHRALFPSNEPNQISSPYEFRFYPATGNYAGVANGRVYTLGPMNNGALMDHGTVESFACQFKPDRCASPGMLTSIPTPTYPAGSDVLAAFNYLNKERARCGFGMVAQNQILDTTAKDHLNYIAQNGGRFTHTQIPGRPGFTAVSPSDRAMLLGYGVSGKVFVGEALASGGGVFNSSIFGRGLGVNATRSLLNAPYHALGLLDSHKETGAAYELIEQIIFDSKFTFFMSGLILNSGFPDFNNRANNQDVATDAVRTYPCQGSTDIDRQLRGEVPNPVAPRNLETNPIGSSIMIKTNPKSVLSITGASMTNVSNGAPINLLPTLTKLNDPNSHIQSNNVAVVMPNAPLDPMTDYKVVINGTNNGVAFKREFQFRTGKDFVASPQ